MRFSAVLLLFLLLLCVVVEVHSQTAYVTFEGTVLSNHSYVDLTRVGSSSDGSDTVQCHTDLTSCCSGTEGSDRGDWFFPNGNRLPFHGHGDIFEARTAQRVDLNRSNSNDDTNGIYQCTIETNTVKNGDGREIVYVGLYAGGGGITISSLTYTLNSTNPLEFTLTCVSTGGPATNVTWTRDSMSVSGTTMTVLDDRISAQYTHTLTVSLEGSYQCTVSNNKPSSSNSQITVQATPPGQPSVSVGPTTATSISLSWSVPSGSVVNSYEVMWERDTSECPDEDEGSTTITDGSTSYTIMKVEEDSTYTITVNASNAVGSAVSESVSGMTDEAVPSAPPTSVTTSDVTYSSITVRWGTVNCIQRNGDITDYLVRYRLQGSGEGDRTVMMVSGDSSGGMYEITGLTPSTMYSIEVAAVNSAGTGNYSSPITETTDDLLTMIQTSSTPTSLTISWTVADGVTVTGYSLSYSNTNTSCFSDPGTVSGSETQYTLRNLEEFTEYTITVTVMLSGGGTGQVTTTATTMPAVPSASPTSVTTFAVTSSSITVQWGTVNCREQNGDITGYSVRYGLQGSGEGDRTVMIVSGDSSGGMYEITGLTQSTTYTIEVAAVNSVNTGPYSTPLVVDTLESVFFSLNGDVIPNHGYVVISDIGTSNDGALLCNTNYIPSSGHNGGNWFAPEGTSVGGSSSTAVPGFRRNRGPGVVRLISTGSGSPPEGIYTCTVQDNSMTTQSVYVGLYNSGGGDVTVPDGLTFTLDPDLNGESLRFTLTCVSTGGPATNITWTRDSVLVSEGEMTVLNDSVTAQYTHTLTVSGRLGGLYQCNVSNNKPSENSTTIVVKVASVPTMFTAVQEGPTSVRVSWNQPSSLGDTTGYRIYYNNGSDSGSEDVSGVSTTSHTLTGLQNGVNYTISIVGTSEHLPSDEVEATVNLVPGQPSLSVNSTTATSISLSWSVPSGSVVDSYEVVWQRDSSDRKKRDDQRGSAANLKEKNYTIMELESGVNYNVNVTAINGAGRSSTSMKVATLKPDTGSPSGQGGTDVGAAIAGVFIALLLAAVIACVIIFFVIWKKKKGSGKEKYTPSSVTAKSSSAHYTKQENIVMTESASAPVIVLFPEETHVEEGEAVLFKVEVTGTPQPKLTWYHNGKEVASDYSRELAADGTLTLFSSEEKQAGVYKLVARNSAGRKEKSVKLHVRTGGEEEAPVQMVKHGPIVVARFGNHVEKYHDKNNQAFRNEYEALYNGGDKSIALATSPGNKLKNRFANICVYDDNRIVLKPIEGHNNDYINASYIDGYTKPKKFIATQGPMPKTMVDFWRMVQQERVASIVMITNIKEGGKTKCEQYWPETGSKNFGPFQVTITDQEILADYTTRNFMVQMSGSERPLKLTHFHFTAWPDHGVPDYATSLLGFYRRVMKQHKSGPIIVHCSAGVGRTGTFITIDRVLEKVEKEGVVDIPGVIQNIRQQRMKMVQTLDQYVFIHDAILESVTCGDTQIEAGHLRSKLNKLQRKDQSGNTELDKQFSILDQVSLNPRDAKVMAALKTPNKNRSTDFLPVDRWRVVLKGESPDYINASVVHGYKQQRAFIIAQGPMQSTARDFWKMIYDRKCGVVVMLSDLVEKGQEVCYQYWPSTDSRPYGEFRVELVGEEKLQGFTVRTLSILGPKSGNAHQVSQFHITNWAPDGSCSNLKTIIDVIDEVGKVQRRTDNKPIVLHCSDTVSRSGMFCAIATTIERCKTEGVVDVFQVVKALRVQKPGAVQTPTQYQIIFESVLVYLDSFALYSNF